MENVVAFMTAASREEARTIARALVEERLAACCNIIAGGVESIYRWEGEVETAEEVMVIIKTTRERFADMARRARELHSYDVPEVIALPIVEGLEEYVRWIGENSR